MAANERRCRASTRRREMGRARARRSGAGAPPSVGKRTTLGRTRRAVVAAALIGGVAALLLSSGAAAGRSPSVDTATVKYLAHYTHSKPGQANPKLPPVYIAWVTNGGGSVVPINNTNVQAAQATLNYINKYLDGVDGHPVKLDVCYVKNAEAEGAQCADSFLNNKKISQIDFGSLAVGASTLESTVNGKKPIVASFSFNAGDVTNKNTYLMFAYVALAMDGWGGFAKQVLHAKTAAVIYPDQPGFEALAQGVVASSKAEGIKTKLVSFNPNDTDLTGAIVAAGGTSADMVAPILTTPSNCLSFYKAADTLHLDPNKIVGFFDCQDAAIKSQYAGGDYPKVWMGIAQSGDQYINNAEGKDFLSILKASGDQSHYIDVWWSGMIAQTLTTVQWMNKLGYGHITPQGMTKQAKAFKGPLFLGQPVVTCGKYKKYPNSCGDGAYFFKYSGNGKFSRYPKWFEPPASLQKSYGVEGTFKK
jgi:branched-chain amino acid transport system substrate-binding protein